MKTRYAEITITVAAEEDEINKNEMRLSDKLSDLEDDIRNYLRALNDKDFDFECESI